MHCCVQVNPGFKSSTTYSTTTTTRSVQSFHATERHSELEYRIDCSAILVRQGLNTQSRQKEHILKAVLELDHRFSYSSEEKASRQDLKRQYLFFLKKIMNSFSCQFHKCPRAVMKLKGFFLLLLYMPTA